MSTTIAAHSTHTSRAPRRHIRNVELQTLDATRIINSLASRGDRTWPAAQGAARG